MRIPADMNRDFVPTSSLLRLAMGLTLALGAGLGLSLAGSETSSRPASPIDLVVETLRIGSDGTVTVATDGARVLPGRGASLEKELKLAGGSGQGGGETEWIRFQAQIQIQPPENPKPTELTLNLSSQVKVLAASGNHEIPREALSRRNEAVLRAGSSQLFEIYDSAALGQRVALHIRWSIPEPDRPEVGGKPIPFVIQLYEVKEGVSELLNENRVQAGILGTAGATFHRNQTIPFGPGEAEAKEDEGRVRQEHLEVTLHPQYLVGGEIGVMIEVAGEVTTLTPERRFSHPLAHQEDYLLTRKGLAQVDLGVVSTGVAREGWERISYRLEVRAFF